MFPEFTAGFLPTANYSPKTTPMGTLTQATWCRIAQVERHERDGEANRRCIGMVDAGDSVNVAILGELFPGSSVLRSPR